MKNMDIQLPPSYIWCGKFTSPNDKWCHMRRRLEEYELFVVTEGVLYVSDGKQDYEVRSGEYLIMSPTSIQYGTHESRCSFYWLHFHMNEDGCHIIKLCDQGRLKNLERLIILMVQLQDVDRRYNDSYMSDIVCTQILLEIANQCMNRSVDEDSKLKRVRLCTAIKDYIRWNRYMGIKVSELAAYFGYNEKYLSSIFKEAEGITLKKYIITEQMEYAKSLLADSNMSISDIAYSVGFSDSHNFSHAFKNETGVTPTQYRYSCIEIPKTP